MRYKILHKTDPKMPRLSAGTECISLLPKNASKDIREPLKPMLFPLLGAHFSYAPSADADKKMKETCCMMAAFAADPTEIEA